MSEREKEREKGRGETQTETNRAQRETDRDRQTDRQTETDRQTDRQTEAGVGGGSHQYKREREGQAERRWKSRKFATRHQSLPVTAPLPVTKRSGQRRANVKSHYTATAQLP